MRKTILMMLGCLLTIAIAGKADCGQGLYIGANIGPSIQSDADFNDPGLAGNPYEFSFDTGWAINGVAGYDFGNIRIEGELGYQNTDMDEMDTAGMRFDLEGDVGVISALLSAYFDYENETAFTPFVGVGFGLAQIEINDYTVSGSGAAEQSGEDAVLAYQVCAGMNYDITQKFLAEMKYRFLTTEDTEFGATDSEFTSHSFLLGIRYYF